MLSLAVSTYLRSRWNGSGSRRRYVDSCGDSDCRRRSRQGRSGNGLEGGRLTTACGGRRYAPPLMLGVRRQGEPKMPIPPELTKQYEDFLNPEVLRPRLLVTSIFITGFESLKAAIVDRLRSFYWRGFDQDGEKIDPRYDEEVLSRDKRSPVRASLLWLLEEGAIEKADLEAYDRIRLCRNLLAHELLDIVSTEGLPEGFNDRFEGMVALLRKIEVWWIQNVELAIDPDYADKEVDLQRLSPVG